MCESVACVASFEERITRKVNREKKEKYGGENLNDLKGEINLQMHGDA